MSILTTSSAGAPPSHAEAAPPPRLVRAHDRDLSLWQSAVSQTAREELGPDATAADVLAHPLMVAANDHVQAVLDDRPGGIAPGNERDTAAYVSHLSLAKANALLAGDAAQAAALDAQIRPFSDDDPLFATCEITYLAFQKVYNGRLKYNDWTVDGGGKGIDYGVIDWRLPNDAVVGIIGDWGTGLDDAEQLLRDLMVQHQPTAIIHLGDIYYSGTPTECAGRYGDVITAVFDDVLGQGKRIPVFTLAGNHDYYAYGYAFYDEFTHTNDGLAGCTQEATYFCLRTEDDGWQFLAMDSSYDDANPLDQIDALYAGPQILPNEQRWLRDKLDNFAGVTVLLSHHQLFTANARINGRLTAYPAYQNTFLQGVFQPYFATKVGAWLWGHEHNFVAYANGIFGLAKGRLVGCSAYEEEQKSTPYAVNWPEVPYLDPTAHQLTAAAGYYNHGYAVIKLAGRSQPTAPVTAEYYEYPSWAPGQPVPKPASSPLLSEQFARPLTPPADPVLYGAGITLRAASGQLVGPLESGSQYYPTMVTTDPVTLQIRGGAGVIRHGDDVQVQTTESSAGSYNVLGAWAGSSYLYYYTAGYDEYNQGWQVQKRDPTDPELHHGDDFQLVSRKWTDQAINPVWSPGYSKSYLTTATGSHYWQAW